MQLLVSVKDEEEARAALAGGADLIDAKDPGRGALGPVAPATLAAICAAVAGARPVTAALGDATDGTAAGTTAAGQRAARGLRFVKLGFGGVTDEVRAARLGLATRRALAVSGLVLVAYADWRRVDGLDPARVIAIAQRIGADGVLFDTAYKDTPLFGLAPPERVAVWASAVHSAAMFVALAGSLTEPDFETARVLGADVVGVRGAACVGGRTGRVSPARVARLRAFTSLAPGPRVGALA